MKHSPTRGVAIAILLSTIITTPTLAAAASDQQTGLGPVAADIRPIDNDRVLQLKTGDVDTTGEFNFLDAMPESFPADTHYVIQLDGPMTAQRGQDLAAAGIALGDYLPLNAYVVRLDAVDPAALAALDFVAWVGEFRPEWKIDPELGIRPYITEPRQSLRDAGDVKVVVVLFEGEDIAAAEDELLMRGATLINSSDVGPQWFIDATMTLTDALALADMPAVQFVEDAPEGTFRNSTNRWIAQSNVSATTPVWNQGIRGEGQMGGLIDGTIRESHCQFDDTVAVGPTHRKIVAMRNAGAVDSHGTHTGGTMAGDSGTFGVYDAQDGLALAAKISFSNVDNVYASTGTLDDRLLDAHNDGARVHSNSWGDDGTTAYTTWCRQIDLFSYQNEESLVCFAVTNLSTLKTPENAKNVLAVGASQDTPNQASHCSGGTGPTADMRRKPEVYLPGCGTTSANSATTCSTTSFTGTSMACPAVSAAGLLVRQYFTDGYYPTGVEVPANALTPSGALIKAVLINTSVDMTGISGYPSNLEGWGRVLLDNALYFSGDARDLYVVDVRNSSGLSTGVNVNQYFTVNSNTQPLRVTLVFTEPAAAVNASNPTINNLDLEVTEPGGAVLYRGNVFTSGQSATGGSADAKNNVEQVHRTTPVTGDYTITIKGTSVTSGLQGYALVVTGDITPGACAAPGITTHPATQSVCAGSGVTFNVAATGTAPLSYQWRKNSVNIGGATGTSYTIISTIAGDAGNYDCVVTNACGSATSNAAVLTINTSPSISGQPASITRCVGTSATFTVTASGTAPITYQWRKNTANIGGATSSSYNIASVIAGDAANYDCVVTNTCGNVTTAVAVLTVTTAPSITSHPSNVTVCSGGPASFSVSATGSTPLSYQWRKNTVNITGATSSNYSMGLVTTAEAGTYDCVVTNSCGSATSNGATLTVNTAPSITTHPVSQAVCQDGSVMFSVAASGTAPLSYQWRKGAVNIGGATGTTYSINPVGLLDAGNYDCVVTNTCGSATSAIATLTVNTVPNIVTHPSNVSVCEGNGATFNVNAGGAGPLSYQWRKNTVNIGGATNASYTILSTIPADAAVYDCVVTNLCGSTTSNGATLTVNVGPQVTAQPSNLSRCPGDSATFIVGVTGSSPLSYQWRKNSIDIVGAVNASYTINFVVPGDAAVYDCVVTNSCGTTTSNGATLTVNSAPSISSHPASISRCPGDSAAFAVVAAGSAPLSYQWRKNSVDIFGAVNATYTINFVIPGDAAVYDCVVTNACGSITSNGATLSVGEAPAVTSDPASLSRCTGASATFSVAATGSGPLSYQWRKNTVNIGGATSATYTINYCAPADSADYDCVVTNACGNDTSNAATLTVSGDFVVSITSHPSNLTVDEGEPATFNVTAGGTNPLSYQWRKNGVDIGGATSNSYAIPATALGDAGVYDCVVSNVCGSIDSDDATLTVNAVTCEPCDTNCDGSVNPFDIQDFLDLLGASPSPCSPCAGDADGNGTVNPFDINAFLGCL